MNEIKPISGTSTRVLRNGDVQYLEIPPGLELTGSTVTIERDGDRLIVTPIREPKNFRELLDPLEPIDEDFPDVDEGLIPPDDIDL